LFYADGDRVASAGWLSYDDGDRVASAG
jgi:hypothetical protein